jgi:hypothetical protein
MVPLSDIARHDNACPHSLQLQPCTAQQTAASTPHNNNCQPEGGDTVDVSQRSSSECNGDGTDATAEEMCIFWIAGVDLEAGQEVCSSHRGYLTPDVALLLHGIQLPQQQQQQQQGEVTSGLFAMDSSGVDVQDLLISPGVTPEQLAPFEGETACSLAMHCAALSMHYMQCRCSVSRLCFEVAHSLI